MSTLYLLALGAVCAVVLGVMLEAVRNVSRKPVWRDTALAYAPRTASQLQPIEVHPVDPRHSGFVGLSNEPAFQLTA